MIALLKPLSTLLGKTGTFVHDSAHVEGVMSFEHDTAWPWLRPCGILGSDDVNVTASWDRFTAANSGADRFPVRMQEMAMSSDSEHRGRPWHPTPSALPETTPTLPFPLETNREARPGSGLGTAVQPLAVARDGGHLGAMFATRGPLLRRHVFCPCWRPACCRQRPA